MPAKLKAVRSFVPLSSVVLSAVVLLPGPVRAAAAEPLTAAQAQALLDRALAAELRAAQDTSHPMRYLLRKTTPRLSATREIYETRDGDVARLIDINGQPLSPDAEQREQARLAALAADPGRQRHRKQAEDADTARALKVLRALPTAFLYTYEGPGQGPSGPVEKFSFRPNPAFSPPDLETQVLTAMTGAIWIDPAQQRVVRIEGRLQHDVDFGWGILGRLNKGGWIAIEQAGVGGGLWRTVRLQMAMSGRVVWKTHNWDTTEEESRFTPLPVGMSYQQAIDTMRADPAAAR